MKKLLKAAFAASIILLAFLFFACQSKDRPVKIFLAGDSTVADYSTDSDYLETRYPSSGWGQFFQPFMQKDSLKKISIIRSDSAIVDNRSRGGRSTRVFFEEGRWRGIYKDLQPGDIVLIQFGHNDGAETKHERYVDVRGYKEFLRLFVNQTREKGGIPVLITPVTRNFPWTDNVLGSAHGQYPDAMKDIAVEMNVHLIDLTKTSAELFTQINLKLI